MNRVEQIKKSLEVIDQHISELQELKTQYRKKLADAKLTLNLLK
jgi:F0F1-type ATP synthase membrane subunit b/b'